MDQTKDYASLGNQNAQQHGIVTGSDLKKIKKPLLERKRRERINRALAHLKTRILDNIRLQGGTQTAKLDKADILEMTVNYLSLIHYGQNIVSMATDKFLYSYGYQQFNTEAMAYLTFPQPEVGQTLVTVSGDFTMDDTDDVIKCSVEDGSSILKPELVNSMTEGTYCLPNITESTDDDLVCIPTVGNSANSDAPSVYQEFEESLTSSGKFNGDRISDNDNESAVWRPW